MRNTLGIFLAAVFLTLSLLHIYWAAGGRLGSGATVPTVSGKRSFDPSPLGTILVAAALFVATLVILGHLGVFGGRVPAPIFRWGTLGISIIFLLRAIGEFKLIGFFKQTRDTSFAYWDTWLFSPLCLVIAVIAFVLVYIEK